MSAAVTIPDATSVRARDAVEPFVLAIDIGSGSTRCSLYDAFARPIKKRTQKADHAFFEGSDGAVEIDADQVTREVEQVISAVTDGLAPGSIRAVAMDTFASSLVCVNAEGRAITPCITYADSRSAPYVRQLRRELDEGDVHQRTGTRLHASYHPARMLWLKETRPEIWAETAKFLSLGEYIYSRLAGVEGAATSTMAWAGILNRHTLDLDELLLEVTDTRSEQFAPIVDPSEPVADVSAKVARRWPALKGAVWFPAIPDGFASNLGVGADTPEVAALSAATSGAVRAIVNNPPDKLPNGLWSYAVSTTSSIIGGALNDVGRVMLWLERVLAAQDPEDIDHTLRARPNPNTPLMLPFLTGERATGWAADARAVLTGVSSADDPLDLWRAAAEGVAISYARVFEQLQEVAPQLNRMIASGGVSQRYPGLMGIVAQAIGFPVQVVDVKRVTMRGAAVLALSVIAPGHPTARIPRTDLTTPDPSQRDYYATKRQAFEATYDAIIE